MKQAIVVRTDVGMGTGKLAAQVAHASLSALEEADERAKRDWRDAGQKKVVLAADAESDIHDLADATRRERLPYAVVRDAGHTQLEPGTVTALGVGPGGDDRVDRVTGELPLL